MLGITNNNDVDASPIIIYNGIEPCNGHIIHVVNNILPTNIHRRMNLEEKMHKMDVDTISL